MKKLYFLLIFFFPALGFAQKWVDTTYSIQTVRDIQYGTATDFAGTPRSLDLDISYPIGDTTPLCGRPLIVIVHGGAWLVGDKADIVPVKMREDFAKRGYTSASVNYRLGQFNTNNPVNCNVSTLFNVPWNCLNMTDSSEWYRANHRGIQDVKGAIRYLVNNASTYDIDPSNVFITGESAGGFIAMGAGFLDDTTEVLTNLTGLYPDAPSPNTIYESPCIQATGYATDIASMDLSRPDLGSYEGLLNSPTNTSYKIKGVGNFFGAVFNNIFHSTNNTPPALYLYHQPCDLIVPHNYNRVFSGYQNCFMGFPTSCGYIINRPLVHGSYKIKAMLDTMINNSLVTPDYLFDNTNNQWNCLQQTNTSQVCHAIDNYWLRTSNMASFFATKIDTCQSVGIDKLSTQSLSINVYPNPTTSTFNITFDKEYSSVNLNLLNHLGQRQISQVYNNVKNIMIPIRGFTPGVYYLSLEIKEQFYYKKIIIN